MYKLQFNGKSHAICLFNLETSTGVQIKKYLSENFELPANDYYLIRNGKIVSDQTILRDGVVELVPRVLGGKGGFGSMLRAIGAQIEKTTNREACRDLSGRRLRDINEEQRLKNWINKQADREKEAKEKKQKKLERLLEKPKYEFKDEEYFKEREVLPELVEDAVLQGLGASTSSKRKTEEPKEVVKPKKKKLWVDDGLDDLSSDIDSDSDSEDKHDVKLTDGSGHSTSDKETNSDSDKPCESRKDASDPQQNREVLECGTAKSCMQPSESQEIASDPPQRQEVSELGAAEKPMNREVAA